MHTPPSLPNREGRSTGISFPYLPGLFHLLTIISGFKYRQAGNMRDKVIYIAVFLFVAIGCKQPYIAPRISSGANYLVVEGFINTSTVQSDSTVFKLSRTVNLSGKASSRPELNASVSIFDSLANFKF